MSRKKKPLTLVQFKRQKISELWTEYTKKRERLDRGIESLSAKSSAKKSRAALPTCNTDGCTNAQQIKTPNGNYYVCEVRPGQWVMCDMH